MTAFGDEPVAGLASGYDLVIVDHPFCGLAAAEGSLLPLDDLLGADALSQLRRDAIGPSQRSYTFDGRTWALAVDAACQVSAMGSAIQPDEEPDDWRHALDLVRRLRHRAAVPLAPAQAICSLLTLWASAGLQPLAGPELIDVDRGLEAVEWLSEVHALAHPAATDWEPPAALAALGDGVLDYIPLTFGYVSYASRDGVRFTTVPGVRAGVLGGAGLAVPANAREAEEAAAFSAWACSSDVQRRLVAANGGQPASRACWYDPALDADAGDFYSATVAGLETAWVRPREAWWPHFQVAAGQLLSAGLRERVPPDRLLAQLLVLHAVHLDRGSRPRPQRAGQRERQESARG